MEPVILDCKALEWQQLFSKHAAQGEEIDLIHFSPDFDVHFCQNIAQLHRMEFVVDPEHDTAFLRKKKDV